MKQVKNQDGLTFDALTIELMAVPIHVDAYSGYKANERPRQFVLDEEIYEIVAVLDQWYEPSATYFKVLSTEGKTYLLRYDEQADEWTLSSRISNRRGQFLPVTNKRPPSG